MNISILFDVVLLTIEENLYPRISRIVLEILREEKQVSEIASREEINRTQLQNWKKEFKDVLITVDNP